MKKKSIMLIISMFIFGLFGSIYYNNYTSKGSAVLKVEEKEVMNDSYLIHAVNQVGEGFILQIHESDLHLVVEEEIYFFTFKKRLFDKYPFANKIEHIDNAQW